MPGGHSSRLGRYLDLGVVSLNGLDSSQQSSLNLMTLAGLLLACGLRILFAHRPRPSDGEWVFDRPEAWQPHELRNPWTGAVSKPGEEWGE